MTVHMKISYNTDWNCVNDGWGCRKQLHHGKNQILSLEISSFPAIPYTHLCNWIEWCDTNMEKFHQIMCARSLFITTTNEMCIADNMAHLRCESRTTFWTIWIWEATKHIAWKFFPIFVYVRTRLTVSI